jgi:hypothetical protein
MGYPVLCISQEAFPENWTKPHPMNTFCWNTATNPPVTLVGRPHRTRSQSWDCRSLRKIALHSRSGHQRPPAYPQWRPGRNPHGAGSWRPPVGVRHLKLPFPTPRRHHHPAPIPQRCLQSARHRWVRQWPSELGKGGELEEEGLLLGLLSVPGASLGRLSLHEVGKGAHRSPNSCGQLHGLGHS